MRARPTAVVLALLTLAIVSLVVSKENPPTPDEVLIRFGPAFGIEDHRDFTDEDQLNPIMKALQMDGESLALRGWRLRARLGDAPKPHGAFLIAQGTMRHMLSGRVKRITRKLYAVPESIRARLGALLTRNDSREER